MVAQKGFRRVIGIDLAERGWIPDFIVRHGIRRLLRERLKQQNNSSKRDKHSFYANRKNDPIAVQTEDANRQHYEMPAEMFKFILGPRMKYSCCLYPTGNECLAEAEEAMLELTCQRADIRDGMSILELGCGWGSLSLWIAERFPETRIVAVSNSASQKEYIDAQARKRGIQQITVLTKNLTEFDIEKQFDRVISIEMFEHMRNYHQLLERIAGWLKPDGKLFVHIFCHRLFAYLFETDSEQDWMAKYFFTGGIMPSEDIFSYFSNHLRVASHWAIDGNHYAKTCEDWISHQDLNSQQVFNILYQHLPADLAKLQFHRWRIFFMACAELFRFSNGREWKVGHYLLEHAR